MHASQPPGDFRRCQLHVGRDPVLGLSWFGLVCYSVWSDCRLVAILVLATIGIPELKSGVLFDYIMFCFNLGSK